MKPAFRPAAPSDLPAIRDFLARTFGANPSAPFLEPKYMEWRYFHPCQGWEGTRGFLIERDGAILAFGAAWPGWLRFFGPQPAGFQLIDWAADPQAPGMGAALMRRMSSTFGPVWVYGGTEDAVKARVANGFVSRQTVTRFAQPLRPIREELTRGEWNWKVLPRVVRNVKWRLTRPALGQPLPRMTSAEYAAAREAAAPDGVVRFDCPASFLRFLSACPVATAEFYGRAGLGGFILIKVPRLARIVDAWCAREQDPAAWSQIYSAAAATAATDPNVFEVNTFAATTPVFEALQLCGFHRRGAEDMMLYDPQSRFPSEGPVRFQMLQCDAAFRVLSPPEYMC